MLWCNRYKGVATNLSTTTGPLKINNKCYPDTSKNNVGYLR